VLCATIKCIAVITCKRGSAAVVRTSCCSYGKGLILNLSRAETTEPINTKVWTIDYLGEIIAKFGLGWFYRGFSPCGWNVHFYCFFFLFRQSGYRPQFATDFDVLWLKRRRLALECAFWASEVLKASVRGSKSPKSGPVGKSQPKRKRPKIPYNFVI